MAYIPLTVRSSPSEPLQVEVMPKLLKTLLRDGRFVDTEFDSM